MLQHIIAFSIRQKFIIALLTFGLVVWGAVEVTRLPIDAVPDITNNQVQIITVTPGLSATDAERLITFPIEQACSNISGIKELRSFSRFGLSVITVVFHDDTDVYWARQQIAERLQQVQSDLPVGQGTPYMAPVTTGLGEIYQYVLRPKKGYEQVYDAQKLRTIQDWIVRRALLRTEGVADVSSFGGLLKQYVVQVKPEQLKAYGVTIDEVFQALEKNNQNAGGAYIEKGPTVLFIRTEGLIGSEEEIQNISIKTAASGAPLLIRDVADVVPGNAVRYGAMTYNDQGEVTGAVVMMLKGENSSKVIERVKTRVDEIRKQLPEGVEIEAFLDRTKMVNHAIGTVKENLAMAGLIVVFVLVFFFGSLRAGLLVASVIPLSMLFAVIMMNRIGVSGNLMSLGAIDFGLIVDGAVIIVEAVLHLIASNDKWKGRKELTKEEMDGEVKFSASKMMNSAVFGQLIIFIVYLPILNLQGIEGKMFKPMAQTVALAIAGAFILSLTYVPMMSAFVLSRKVTHHETLSDKLMNFFQRVYRPILEFALHRKKFIIGSTITMFALSIVLLGTLGGEFIPELEEGDFAVETRVLTGSNLNTSVNTVTKAAAILKKFPEVEKVVTKIGSGEIPTDPMPIEAADMMIILKDKSEWTTAETFDDLAQIMTDSLSIIPGMTVGFQYPVQMRFNELMTGARQDVVCKIFGENLDTLAHYADQLSHIAGGVDGAVEMYVERVTGMPQVVIQHKRDQLAKYNLSIEAVNRAVNMAFAGASAGKVYEGEKRFDLVVRLAGESRENVDDIRQLLISTPSGQQVPLYLLADVNEIEGPNQIQREDAHRRIVVGFNVRGRDVQTIVNELQQKVEAQIKLPPGYSITYGGAFENLQEAKDRLAITIPIALLMILLLLYFTFRNFTLSILVFSAIPLSAIGGIAALWLRGMPFSISAGVGFIALFGIAVLDSIVLIAKFTELKQETNLSIREIIFEGTRVRLRPVLIAAMVPALGFLPMALSNGAGAEVQRPLATVVIGGLVSSTLLTLVMLPVLYSVLYERKSKLKVTGTAAAVLLMLLAPQFIQAQKSITLDEALAMAEANYPAYLAEQQRVKAAEAMKGTAWNLAPTDVGFEYGNVNSLARDNRFSVDQSFALPGVYQRQKLALNAEWELSKRGLDVVRQQMRTDVRRTYLRMQVAERRKAWLDKADSIYRAVIQSADLQVKAGAISATDYASVVLAEQQVGQWLVEWQVEYTQLQQTLAQLTGSLELLRTAELSSSAFLLDASLTSSPALQMELQRAMVYEAQWKAEQSKKWPSLRLGFYNMTIIGWQTVNNQDTYFDSGRRFTTVTGGLSIPLFTKAYNARSASLKWTMEEQQLRIRALEMQYKSALLSEQEGYKQYSARLADFERTLLPQSEQLMTLSTQQLQQGEISISEWAWMMKQSIDTRFNYFATLNIQRDHAVAIGWLTGTN